MMKWIYFLNIMFLGSISAFAASNSGQGNQAQKNVGSACSNMSTAEQTFANQLNDSNNRSMFCSQFTPQQRLQAMQLAGQLDVSGNPITADQAVQQVMQSSSVPSTQPKVRPGGGCPVK